MKILRIFLFYVFLSQLLFAHDFDRFKSRISFMNFGLDYTKYSNPDEIYRSISVIPIMVERENFEVGLCLTPFIKENYDSFGSYQYEKLMNSYLLNLRLRFIGYTTYQKVKFFADFAYCDGNFYNWKDIRISWLEVGFFSRLNYASKLFVGYRHTLITNEDIDMNGLFVSVNFGYSLLKRK